MEEKTIRDRKPDLVSILPYSIEQLQEAARTAATEGLIDDRDQQLLNRILEDFEANRLESEERTIHDLIKYTVRSPDTKDELSLEQLIYKTFDLGIPSMWGPVIE